MTNDEMPEVTYQRGKEAINYLFKELQFCVDTKETPAGYSMAHNKALDCLNRLGMIATKPRVDPDTLTMSRADFEGILQFVSAQAEDDGLWFIAESASEAYLQQELRKLHTKIEAITIVQKYR